MSLLVAVSAALAEDWPQFRGPTGQGIAEKAGPRAWSTREGVAWQVEVPGQGWSSPVILDGKVVLTTAKGEGEDIVLAALAYDAASGEKLWEKELFEPPAAELKAMHAKNSLASSTPVLADGVAYAHFGHMGTAALKLADGEVLWKRKIEYKPVHGSGSSPVLADGRLVFNADGEENPAVVALDGKTGEIAWRSKRDHRAKSTFSFSTPLVVDNGGRMEIISPASGMVGAYAPEDGELLWKVGYKEGFSVVPRPVEMDGCIFVCTGFMSPELLAIRKEGAGGDVTKSHVKWSADRQIPKTPSVIAHGGKILAVDDTGRMSCLDAGNGKVKWQEKLTGNFSASPVLAGGKLLYALTEDGVAYVVEISDEGGKVISEVDMGDRLFASPAVVDGALYLRSEKRLWKIAGK